MTGAEAAVGHVCVWLTWTAGGAQRERYGPDAPDAPEADRIGELDHLYSLVCSLLGDDPALRLATQECAAPDGAVTERTRRRLTDALDEAIEREAAQAAALRRALDRLRDHRSDGGPPGHVSAGADGIAIRGGVTVEAHDGSAAALRMGDVRIGDARPVDARPGDARADDVRAGDVRAGDVRAGDVRRENPPVPGPPQG